MLDVSRHARDSARKAARVAVVAAPDVSRSLVALIEATGRATAIVQNHAVPTSGATTVVVAIDPSVAAERTGLRELRQACRSIGIVAVVPADTDHSNLRETIAAGAEGVILDSEADTALSVALDAVAQGQVVVPRDLIRYFRKPVLSAREKQVLSMVVMGFSNAEIAGRLFLAESTVKSHLSSAFSRLGVKSRKQATALILDPESGLGPGILGIPSDAAPLSAA
jgi:DNA-binding NarL/FixJ family response regulator